jgi:hypothetical protein
MNTPAAAVAVKDGTLRLHCESLDTAAQRW